MTPRDFDRPNSGWLRFWHGLEAYFWRAEQRARERYLAQAQDICDLESRLRQLEQPTRGLLG